MRWFGWLRKKPPQRAGDAPVRTVVTHYTKPATVRRVVTRRHEDIYLPGMTWTPTYQAAPINIPVPSFEAGGGSFGGAGASGGWDSGSSDSGSSDSGSAAAGGC